MNRLWTVQADAECAALEATARSESQQGIILQLQSQLDQERLDMAQSQEQLRLTVEAHKGEVAGVQQAHKQVGRACQCMTIQQCTIRTAAPPYVC